MLYSLFFICFERCRHTFIFQVGVYRVSGSSADMARLKKAYETNPYEAEQLLKVVVLIFVVLTAVLKG